METSKKPEIGDLVKLTKQQVLSEMSIDESSRKAYNSTSENSSRAGKFFYVGTYMGIGFVASESLFEAWSAGKVAEINLVFKPYDRKVIDPLNPGTPRMETRDAWNVTGFSTYDQVKNVTKSITEIGLIEKSLQLDYRIEASKKLKGLELDEHAMAFLKDAV